MKPLDIKELQNRLDAIGEEQVKEDSYDSTTPDGHEIKDLRADDDYETDAFVVKLDTPMGSISAAYDSGMRSFNSVQSSNKILSKILQKTYDEYEDAGKGDKEFFSEIVGKAVDKAMSMAKDNPSFMRSESVEEGDAELAELKDIMGRSGVMGLKF